MAEQKPVGTVAVLDIETAPDPMAVALAPRGGPSSRSALHRLKGFSLLMATENRDFQWSDLSLTTHAHDDEFELLFAVDTALAAAQEAGATLITYNGAAHDVPMLRHRTMANWLFALPALAALESMPHRDLMRDATRGFRTKWPSLADLCASLGISMNHLAVRSTGETPNIAHRKSQVDTVATFLLHAHNLSAQRAESRTVSRAWLALADFLKRPEVRQPHLTPFALHRLLEQAKEEADLI